MAYTCDHCELVFSDKTELLLHVETITDEKPYQCAECELVFSDKTELLLLHVETITDEKPYKCAHCDKIFANTDNFRIHYASHNDKNDNESNNSNSNNASAKTNTHLTDLYTQSGNKDSDNNSTNYTEFSKHIQYPSGQKSFQCNECDKTFSKNSNLKIHRLTHEGSKIHKCKHREIFLLIIVVLLTI